jgi:type III pantothenate kinase
VCIKAQEIIAAGAPVVVERLRQSSKNLGIPFRAVGTEIPIPDLGQYATMGVDRILAGLSGVKQHGPCIIIDAGTAITLGAWTTGPRFLGGLIAPGPRACLTGLHHCAPALPLVTCEGPVTALARDTPSALRSAIRLGHWAMIHACLQAMQRECALSTILLTGGQAEEMQQHLPEAILCEHLVLDGLAILVQG